MDNRYVFFIICMVSFCCNNRNDDGVGQCHFKGFQNYMNDSLNIKNIDCQKDTNSLENSMRMNKFFKTSIFDQSMKINQLTYWFKVNATVNYRININVYIMQDVKEFRETVDSSGEFTDVFLFKYLHYKINNKLFILTTRTPLNYNSIKIIKKLKLNKIEVYD